MARLPLLGALLIGSAFVALPQTAKALEPPTTQSTVQIAGGPRFGTNDRGFGVGLRGGYTMPSSIYLGGVFDYFFGSTDEKVVPGAGSLETKARFWSLGAEIGYDLGIAPSIVIRPIAGIGFARGSTESCTTFPDETKVCTSGSDNNPFFELGGSFNWFNGRFMLGGDARFLQANSGALILGGHIGVKF